MADTQNTRRSRGRPRDWHDKTEQNTIKSLDRALYVFKHLSLGESKPLTELAEETDQSPATVYRILITLQGQGLVEFDPEDREPLGYTEVPMTSIEDLVSALEKVERMRVATGTLMNEHSIDHRGSSRQSPIVP